MESELRSAWIMAGVKLGLGLFFVCAVIGIRVVSVSPKQVVVTDPAPPRAEESLREAALPVALRSDRPAETTAGASGGRGRGVDGVREAYSDGQTGSRDGDKMVSCRLAGRTQFMRADDCAMRGGISTVFESDR